MRRPASLRKALAVVASSLVTFSAGVTAAVFVATSASAASPTTTTKAKSGASPTKTQSVTPKTPKSPAAHFFVLNGTVNAASVHVVGGSSAFPNFATGAVDNYYTLAHSHVDNSPSAEGRASPFDTGPIGQTAAAGHFQQPQYAEARWPGDSGKATYGKQGEPYAAAEARAYHATAEASLASRGSGGPSGPGTLPVPKELDDRLRQALAAWKADWERRLAPMKPAATLPTPTPTVTTPTVTVGGAKPKPPVTVPSPPVPSPPVPSPPVPPPPAPTPPAPTPTVPSPTLPTGSSSAPSRSLASASASPDGVFLLESSTLATFDPKTGTAKTAKTKSGAAKTAKTKSGTAKTDTAKTGTLVTSGESSLGRVSLGGGQIVIKGIHVSASIANDGSPTYKAAISVADASIGGVPVTIGQDGVHVAGKGQGLPYQQASEALNGALKQAGIQLFLVAPEVTTSSCAQPGAGPGTGPGPGPGTGTTTSTTSSEQSGTPSSCPPDQTGMTATCEPTGTGTGTTSTSTTTTGTTTTTPLPTPPSDQSGTTTTTSSCGDMGMTTSTTNPCLPTGTATGTTTTSNSSTGTTTTTSAIYPAGTTTTTTTSSSDQMGAGTGTTSPGQQTTGQQTVRATGVHVVFTQPANQPGVPAQNVEYVLGEVFVDSLAVPAGPLPDLGFSSSSPSSCLGGGDSAGTGASSGASIAGGSSSGSLSPSGSTFGSASQPSSGSSASSNGTSLPAAFASALRKPLWLLLAYVVWQALVIGTGVSLWNWRRGDAT